MRREELVARNLRLSAARHAASPRQRARQAALRCVAKYPVPQRNAAGQQRILLIRPDHMGDALLTIPAVTALRAAFRDLSQGEGTFQDRARRLGDESDSAYVRQIVEFVTGASDRSFLTPDQG